MFLKQIVRIFANGIAKLTIFMRRMRIFAMMHMAAIFFAVNANAQQSVVDAVNKYGTFDSWSMRQVKESGIIGGETETLYEFYGNQETVFTGKTPFSAPEGYIWRTNNVLAIVAGVVKTNNTVYPEQRGNGYCALTSSMCVSILAQYPFPRCSG